jgi:8-oxo-dGTP diphosphatase
MTSPPTSTDRPRVSAAVFRQQHQEILMVQHRRRDGTTYWQLPGGGLLAGERPEDGVLRELYEETQLLGRVVQPLFTIPYKYGFSSTYLVAVDAASVPVLGSDPEEQHAEHRKLVAIAWQPVAGFPDNPELIEALRWLATQLCQSSF